jgi:acyl-CoA hydrolase
MPQVVSLARAIGLMQPGMHVYVPGCSAESLALAAALEADPERAAGVSFVGVWVPGINRFDYASLHPEARSVAFFVPPECRASFMAGRLQFYPMPYTRIYGLLTERLPCDIAFFHLSPPDKSRYCSPGVAADFSSGMWRHAKVKIGLINRRMPRTRSHGVPYDDLDYSVELDSPLVEYPPAPADAISRTIAMEVAKHIHDGDVLQIGIGVMPGAVLSALRNHRNLRFHSGLISDSVMQLIDSGAISGGDSIKTGVALGTDAFYQRVAAEPSVSFHPVPITHGFDQLSRTPNFVSVNGAVSIDLLGQINAEEIGGRQVSGIGGSPDFVRGAIASPGGRAIIALPSTAKGAHSRIVAVHAGGTPIASTRGDGVILVTEHGTADLRDLSLDAKAQALIAIADPGIRPQLADQWREARRSM